MTILLRVPSGTLAELQVNKLYGNAPGGYNNTKSETFRAKEKTVQGKLVAFLVEWGGKKEVGEKSNRV